MDVRLQGQNDLIALVSGMYQEKPDAYFHLVGLGLTNDAIVLYNDNMPDASKEGCYLYNIKVRTPLTEIITVLEEDVKILKGCEYSSRISVLTGDVSTSFMVYFNKENKKYAKNFMKQLKAHGIKTKSRKYVDAE